MTSNLIKQTVSHAIQGIYWAEKKRNVNLYRFCCKKKNYFLQQR